MLEDENKELKRQLNKARHAIIHLAPERYQDLLFSYHKVETWKQSYKWLDEVAGEIVERLLQSRSQPSIHIERERSDCPLCGEGTQDGGFKIYLGLERHLTGFGTMRRCEVTDAAHGLATEYWATSLAGQETWEQEWNRRKAEMEERRETEIQYIDGPYSTTELIDEHWVFKGTRDQEKMAFAEKRLTRLGFDIRTKNRIRSYEYDREDFVIFADIRSSSKIMFYVYEKPLVEKTPRRKHYPRWIHSFDMLDTFKHDLKDKFRVRLEPAYEKLKKKKRK